MSKQLNFSTLLYVMFFFTVVDNRFMVYKPVLYAVYTLRIIYAFIGYYLVFRKLKVTGTISYSRLLLLQLLLSFVIIFSGIINNNITLGIFYSIFIWIGITAFILNLSRANLTFLRTLDSMFQLVMIITLALTALLPNLMITYNYDGSRIVEGFFGGKNALSMHVLMGLCLNLLVYERDGDKRLWRQFLYPLVCTLLLLMSGSGTGSVIAIIFIILYYTKLYKLLNVYSITIIHTILIFSIVVYNLHERYFYTFIVNILHRDITLTYRTDIWSIAIKNFKNNWLLGYGLGNDIIAQNLLLPSWYQKTINETHNGILDIALSLGVVGLISFLLLMINIIRAYDKSDNKNISKIMKLYIFLYFVIAISESAFTLSRLTFWSMLAIGLQRFRM